VTGCPQSAQGKIDLGVTEVNKLKVKCEGGGKGKRRNRHIEPDGGFNQGSEGPVGTETQIPNHNQGRNGGNLSLRGKKEKIEHRTLRFLQNQHQNMGGKGGFRAESQDGRKFHGGGVKRRGKEKNCQQPLLEKKFKLAEPVAKTRFWDQGEVQNEIGRKGREVMVRRGGILLLNLTWGKKQS